MIIVSKANGKVWQCIGYQTYQAWKNYQELLYIVKTPANGGTLWYNLLTREVILLDENEENMLEVGNDYILGQLVKKWFFVPEDVDQKSLVYSFWQAYYCRHPFTRGRLSLVTIFTTTDCNARCPYCYEYGVQKHTMTPVIAEQTANYIIQNAAPKLTLKWFGGEPLLNTDAIDNICRRIGAAGIDYNSGIVSNAYLFDQITDDQIKNIWKLSRIQITIDGTRDKYLQIKGLPEDAYDKLFATIKRLAKLQVHVTIRMHVAQDNATDLIQLAAELRNQLSELGKYQPYVSAYVAPLFEGLGKDGNIITDEERNRIYDNYIFVCDKLTEFGVAGRPKIPVPKGRHCMADNGHSIVITPKGSLTPCEHHIDTEICGNVFDGGRIPDKWQERTPETPECVSCFYYPQCNKLKLCEGENPCNDAYRRFMRYQAERAAKASYEQYQKGERNGTSNRSSRS